MKRSQHFPWRAHNHFELLIDGDEFYPAMLDAINHAENFILLEQYIIESGQVFNELLQCLIKARQRKVKIYIIADDYGSQRLSVTDREMLLSHEINLVMFNPPSWAAIYRSMHRNHRKLLVVDNRLAFVGGANISDKYLDNNRKSPGWHDVMMRISGEVIPDWCNSFCRVWHEATGEELTLPESAMIEIGEETGRVCLAYGFMHNEITRAAISHVRKSDRRVWITSPYFVTTRRLRHELKRAANRGVDVRLLLPGPISDHRWVSQAARRYYNRMLKNGIRIFEYQPRFIHAKIIMCDDWISLGSSNLDRWNQRWNYEANQSVLDASFTEQVVQLFEHDFTDSKVISLAEWTKRSPWQRFHEWLSGHYVSALQWFIHFITHMNKKSGR